MSDTLAGGGPSSVSQQPAEARHPVTVQMIGGPTALLELAGLRILLDPTFSPAGQYESASGRFLTKTEGPAVAIEELGPIDAVLLSHDQHVDNLDPLGRVVLEDAPVVLTTMSGANRLGGASRGLVPWQRVTLKSRTESDVYVMAVPAQHGPDGTTHITGDVTGFVLSGAALPTVYISGDNASLALVAQISERVGKVDLAVIFAGGARSPKLLGDAYLTLTGRDAAQAALLLGATFVVPVHCSGWGHFSEGVDAVARSFAEAGIAERLIVVEPGARAVL